MTDQPLTSARATGRAYLQSIIHRCSEMQEWNDSDLEFNIAPLKEADELLDGTLTEDQLEEEELKIAEAMKPKPPLAEWQSGPEDEWVGP